LVWIVLKSVANFGFNPNGSNFKSPGVYPVIHIHIVFVLIYIRYIIIIVDN
jgi:hypothetical protein